MYFQEFFFPKSQEGWVVNFKNIYNSNASVNGNFKNSRFAQASTYFIFLFSIINIIIPLQSTFTVSNNPFSLALVHFLFLILKITIPFVVSIQCIKHVILLFYFSTIFPLLCFTKVSYYYFFNHFTLHCYSEAGMHLDNARQCGQ